MLTIIKEMTILSTELIKDDALKSVCIMNLRPAADV